MDFSAGLREQNTRDRRAALVDAAYELFAKKGFVQTTMEEIADRAGLSRRTAFRYFASKEDLLFPAQAERLAELRAELRPRDGERPFATVQRACLAVARSYELERARLVAQWAIVQREPALLGRELQLDRPSEEAIFRAFLAGDDSARARRRARVRAAAVVGAIRATLREWLENGATSDLGRLGRETFAELEAGFRD